MYVKYLMNRIKSTPSKLWSDWKSFRNYPGMEYRDVHNIMPKSHAWKFPSPGSVKYENSNFNADYFKQDYKIPYRDSPYFVRKIFPDSGKKTNTYHALPITEEDIKELKGRSQNWADEVSQNNIVNISNDHLSLEEKHEDYANMVECMFETRNVLTECKLIF